MAELLQQYAELVQAGLQQLYYHVEGVVDGKLVDTQTLVHPHRANPGHTNNIFAISIRGERTKLLSFTYLDSMCENGK